MIKNVHRRITAFQRDIKIVFTATDLLLSTGTFVLWSFNIENLTVYKMRIFFCGTTAQIASRVPHCWGFLIVYRHTDTHTPRRTPLNKWSACHIHSYLYGTTNTRDKHLCPQWNANPQSQQSSICRPMSNTAQPPRSANEDLFSTAGNYEGQWTCVYSKCGTKIHSHYS